MDTSVNLSCLRGQLLFHIADTSVEQLSSCSNNLKNCFLYPQVLKNIECDKYPIAIDI